MAFSFLRPMLPRSAVGAQPGTTFTPVHPTIPSLRMPGLVNVIAAADQARGAVQAQVTGTKAPAPPTTEDLLDIERGLMLDPVHSMARHFRVYYLPGSIAGGLMSFAPQRPCVPFALHVPSGSATGKTLTQLQNGVRQYYATADAVDAVLYSEKSPGAVRWLRPMLARVGNTITAQTTVANGTNVVMMAFDMSEDGLLSEPSGRPMVIGFNSGNLAVSGGSTTIRIKPQKDFRPRRIELDSTVTNWVAQSDATHGAAVTQILVANEPQTEASGNIPTTAFDYAAPGGGWDFDGDVCAVGAEVDIAVTNNDATVGGITEAGALWGDSAGADDFEP